MKKIRLFSYMILLLLSLTACISDAERQNGKEAVKEGKKLIREYVSETYGKSAKASDFKPCYVYERYDSTVPNLNKIASGYVKATIAVNDTKFDILYNIHNDEVLTKEHIGTVQESFSTYADGILQSGNIIDCKMTLYSMLKEDDYLSGFIAPDIMNYKDLVATGEYVINLTFRCINPDFDSITEEKWKQLISQLYSVKTDSQVNMLFVNYKNEEEFKAEAEKDYFAYHDADSPYYATEEAAQHAENILYMDFNGDKQVLKGE